MSVDEKLDRIESKLDNHINHDYHTLLNTVTENTAAVLQNTTTISKIKDKVNHTNKYIIAGIVVAILELLQVFLKGV